MKNYGKYKEVKNNKEEKVRQLLSLPTSTIDMLHIKSSNKGLNLSDYINDLIVGDGESGSVDELDRRIRENERQYLILKSYVEKFLKMAEKNLEKINNMYLESEYRLQKKRRILEDGRIDIKCNNKNLKIVILALLKTYEKYGKELAMSKIANHAASNRLGRSFLTKEFNKAVEIYLTYTEEEKEMFDNIDVNWAASGGPRIESELNNSRVEECELPRGLRGL